MYTLEIFCLDSDYMDDYNINDIRTSNDFKSVSFSKFQKTKVKKELIERLSDNKVEPACYWAAELICAGHFVDIWDVIIYYVSKHVHIGNPMLPTYIINRIESFKEIISCGYVGNELNLRNNKNIRKMFAEIIATLCASRKYHVFEAVKVKREDFNMTHLAPRLKAPNISYSQPIFKSGDPTELTIAVNELAYNMCPDSKNCYSACYWTEWIIEYEATCKQRKEIITIEKRDFAKVESKYQNDVIWIVWDAIMHRTASKKCRVTQRIIESLLGMFSLRFTTGVKKRRRFLIYNAISLLTDPVDLSIPIWVNKEIVTAVSDKINVVYKDVKNNEKCPPIENNYDITKRSNLDKTIEKLEMMNKII